MQNSFARVKNFVMQLELGKSISWHESGIGHTSERASERERESAIQLAIDGGRKSLSAAHRIGSCAEQMVFRRGEKDVYKVTLLLGGRRKVQ